MELKSFVFILFLLIVYLIYWRIPQKYRNMLLLVASIVFYCTYTPKWIVLILVMCMISYLGGLQLDKKHSKGWCVVWCTVVLLTLFSLKYLPFFMKSFLSEQSLADSKYSVFANIIAPLGLSFYTFSIIAYLVDVYTGKYKAERNLIHYALYILFFPKIICGPIEKPDAFLSQLDSQKEFQYETALFAWERIAWGFFKKVAIADMIGILVDGAWNDIHQYGGITLLIISILYTIQIYCDFSGYSDIAIGIALGYGIEIHENFRIPYFSTTFKDFWNRWHISLNNWFRDYVYFPLGGSRKGQIRKCFNIMVVFLLSGIWHGANWTFGLWGLVHGCFRVVEEWLPLKKITGNMVSKKIYQFLVLVVVSMAWVLFRADNIGNAFYMLGGMWQSWSLPQTMADYVELLSTNVFVSVSFAVVYGISVITAIVYLFWCEKKSRWPKGKELVCVITWTVFWAWIQTGTWAQTGMFIYATF